MSTTQRFSPRSAPRADQSQPTPKTQAPDVAPRGISTRPPSLPQTARFCGVVDFGDLCARDPAIDRATPSQRNRTMNFTPHRPEVVVVRYGRVGRAQTRSDEEIGNMNDRLKKDWDQTKEDLSPKRAKEAIARDWEQTKHDVPGLHGEDLGVNAMDTLREESPEPVTVVDEATRSQADLPSSLTD